MLNTITVQGRITHDLELRSTQTGVKVLTFNIACERDYVPDGGTRISDFIDCCAWGKTAEFIATHFTKGRPIIVDGKLQSRSYAAADGSKRTKWEVQAEHVYFSGEAKKQERAEPTYEELQDDEELPF